VFEIGSSLKEARVRQGLDVAAQLGGAALAARAREELIAAS